MDLKPNLGDLTLKSAQDARARLDFALFRTGLVEYRIFHHRLAIEGPAAWQRRFAAPKSTRPKRLADQAGAVIFQVRKIPSQERFRAKWCAHHSPGHAL